MDNPKALMVLVIRDTDTLGIAELACSTAHLADRDGCGALQIEVQ